MHMSSDWNTEKSPHAESRKVRPTIGLLAEVSTGQGDYQNALWTGIMDGALEQDVNVLCFFGGMLHLSSVDSFESQRNLIYDLATFANVDGVIISATVGNFVSVEEFKSFFDRYRSMPVVGVAISQADVPAVLVDNYSGMRDVVAHLVRVHGYRRVAFVRGPESNEEAERRYRAYIDVLAEYNLPLDLALVAPGSFVSSTGVEAIRLLLDERKVDFEAVVAANDEMALGVLEALQARGLRVPDDIAVVGFDDIWEANAITPALTTVRQPVYELGKQAVDTLLALLRGKKVPAQVTLPTELVVRQSCGCLNPAVMQAAAVAPLGRLVDGGFEDALAKRRQVIVDEMAQAVTGRAVEEVSEASPSWAVRERAERLLDAFVAVLAGEPEEDWGRGFLQELDGALRQAAGPADTFSMDWGQNVAAWQGAISALRRNLLPHLDSETLARAESLWHQARVTIGYRAERVQAFQTWRSDLQDQRLRQVGQSLITTLEVKELMDVLSKAMPGLGIPSAYLALYEEPKRPLVWSRLILAYDEAAERRELPPDGRRFLSSQLASEGILPRDRQYVMVIEPLHFRTQQLGFVLFEVGPRSGEVYDTLRGEISSALQGALLLEGRKQATEALKDAYLEIERQVEERTAELQCEIAERERAQAQSLQLQQEVIEAQKRALQELSTPIIPVMDRIIVMPLIGSIDAMRAKDITRALLVGISEHQARVVILDITGVPLVNSGVAAHLNKTIQAARLKGAHAIVTGISEAVAETIVDLGIDWEGVETLSDLQTGLTVALQSLGIRLTSYRA
jgi:DNA-binding LacI/PurR family transcriptional regulator/anti-anti-sigma regulatory factor